MPLSHLAIQALKPHSKPYRKADGDGLYLLVTAKGSKSWQFRYRFEGREQILSIGSLDVVTLKEAREARDTAKRLLHAGKNPMRKEAESAPEQPPTPALPTFREIALEWFARLRAEQRAPRTLIKNQWLLDFALADLGDMPIAAINAAHVLACVKKIEARGKYESAHRTRGVISAVFCHAVATLRATGDPTQALRGALIRPITTHHAAIIEPIPFGGLLRAIWDYQGAPEVMAALKLAVLLVPRPGELRLAQWSEFKMDEGVWSVPAGRMKMRRAHKIPLSSEAQSILRDLRELTGRGEFLFPSVRGDQRAMSENTLNAALRRMGYTKEEVTAHGFRASFSTLANESGLWSIDAIERHLAHVELSEVRRAYNRAQHWDERVRLGEWWAGYCADLRRGGNRSDIRLADKTNT